ncbi:uncharacterized protein K02A2.6-like [Macrobrachium nipponense]|uniref:uncharacterized protein K02A2.6-like n=1 Tax=Macrobrachium nipponense TaxID=159736 RepID=UPI0030C8509A
MVRPTLLRCKVLDHLHSGHNCMNVIKAEARNWVWWPKIDQDTAEVNEEFVIFGYANNYQPNQAPVLFWPSPGKVWSRLHIDYAGLVDNKYFLVIVDAYTKFMDVHVTSSTTLNVAIELLRKTFPNFVIPDEIVSDNAPYSVQR